MRKKYLSFNDFLFIVFCGHLTFAQCTTTVTNVTASSANICSGTTATLNATHDGDNVYWYDAATNGSLLFTGNPYTTSVLSANTTFWAESRKQVLGTATAGGGKLTHGTSGSAVVAATTPWGLVFNATQSFVLNSVDVFLSSATAGTLVLNLKDSSQAVLQTWSIPTPAGGTSANPVQFTVPLNFTIPVGTGYRLVAVSSPTMIRDTGSNTFPFPIGTVGSITQGTINNSLTSNSGVYYFFYNWNFTPTIECVSTRQQVAVGVTTTNPPTGDAQQLFTSGETIANLDVTGTNLIWYADSGGTTTIPTTTVLTNGTTYYVLQTLNGCPSSLLAITAVTSLNANDAMFSKLNYYPNPVKDVFSLTNLESDSQIEIYTVLGQNVWSKKYTNQEVNLDFSKYNDGIYLVKITSGKATKTIKVIKK